MRTQCLILLGGFALLSGCTSKQGAKNDEGPKLRQGVVTVSIRDTDKNRALLNSIIEYVLTDKGLESSREFYGNAGSQTFALVTNTDYGVPWPDWFVPSISDFNTIRTIEGHQAEPNSPRMLGIRLDEYDVDTPVDPNELRLFCGQIAITMLNAGGNDGDATHAGGDSVYFDSIQIGGKWIVKSNGSIDP